MNETVLHERIRIEGAEEGAAKLGRIAGAAERLSKAFGGISGFAAAAGGIAGMMQIANAVADTDRLYQAIARVKAITGVAAENAHAMFDWFEMSGIGMQQAEAIMLSLARLSGKLGEGVAGSAQQVQTMRTLMRRLGVDIKAGPEERILQMATAAQKGRLRINDLITAFNIPASQASAMLAMLRQGPDRLREIKANTLGAFNVIDDRALEAHEKMLQARRELSAAWGGLVGILYKQLIPAITNMLEKIRNGIQTVEPIIIRVGKFLRDNMAEVVALAATYVKLMAANAAINLFSKEGNEKGLFERIKSISELAQSALTPTRYGRKFAPDGSKTELFSIPLLGRGFAGGSGIVRVLSTVAGRFGVIGVVIGAVIGALHLLKNNTLGIRDSFAKAFGSIISSVTSVFRKLMAVMEKLFAVIKPVLGILGGAFLITLRIAIFWVEMFAKIMDMVMTAIVGIINGVIWAINKIPGVDIDMIDMNGAKKSAEKTTKKNETPGGKETVYQDFRGSKFEITNHFPQNVDGGRVAVAFGDQLARLGERRIDSGVRPLFSYR